MVKNKDLSFNDVLLEYNESAKILEDAKKEFQQKRTQLLEMAREDIDLTFAKRVLVKLTGEIY